MKRFVATVCGLLLLCAAILPASALTPAYQTTKNYQTSEYYTRLCALTATGDAALDTVAVAMTQLTYHEGNSAADLGGGNTGGTGNYTEYNYAFGKISNTYAYAWCASFVSWCLEETGSTEAAGGSFASCTLWVERLCALGLYRTRASGYTPQTGDLIFFRSAGVTRASDHVGLVRYTENGRVFTVEGNSSNRVTLHDYARDDSYIVGYGCPDYAGTGLGLDIPALSGRAAGWYTVTNATLNLRAGPSASFAKVGQLQEGALLKITEIQDGWGRTESGGTAGWVSLGYTDFTSPYTVLVTYENAGETIAAPARFLSTETARIPETVPEKEGFRFLYWVDGDGNIYTAGTLLPATDLTLTAVFEEIPAPPEPTPEDEPLPPATETGAKTGEGADATGQLLASPGETTPPETANTAPADAENTAATAAAAVISGILTLLLCALWVRKNLFCRDSAR